MASMTYLAENHLLRTVRRYGIDVPLRHHFFTLAAALLLVVATLVGACIGLLSSLPDDESAARTALLLSAPVAWALALALGSPARTLRTALDSSRGWALVAGTPASPRTFAYGRYVLPELVKAIVASAAVAGATWGLVVAEADRHPDAAAAAVVATLGITLGVALRAALVLSGPAWRLAGQSPWTIRTTTLGLAGLVAAAYLAADRSTAAAAGLMTAGTAAAFAVAANAHRRLGRVEWADVSDVALRGQSVRHEAPALPEPRHLAILAVDLRRLLRSVEARIRPVVNYAALLVILALGAGAYALFGGPVELPEGLPRGELAAGLCAFAGYGAAVAAGSVLAMDADRHAYTLWSLIPDAMRAVAVLRAAAGSTIVAGCGLATLAGVGPALGLTTRELVLAAVAVFTMAALAPVIELAGSLRWPELDWVDTTEIGTSSGARYVLGLTVGLPVAAALAVARTVDLDPGAAHVAAASLAALLLAPLLAATLMSPVARALTRSSHA